MHFSQTGSEPRQVWCAHNQIPLRDATFLLGTVAVKPEENAATGVSCIFLCTGSAIGQDTLHSLGCGANEELVMRVAGTLVSVTSCDMVFR